MGIPPPKKKIGKNFSGKNHVKFGNFVIFSGKYHVKCGNFVVFFWQILCKIRAFCYFFSGKYHVKCGNFVVFSGKYYVKFGHFVHFSCIYFQAKCLAPPPKLTELLRLWLIGYTASYCHMCRLCVDIDSWRFYADVI